MPLTPCVALRLCGPLCDVVGCCQQMSLAQAEHARWRHLWPSWCSCRRCASKVNTIHVLQRTRNGVWSECNRVVVLSGALVRVQQRVLCSPLFLRGCVNIVAIDVSALPLCLLVSTAALLTLWLAVRPSSTCCCSLSDNNLGPDGAQALAPALANLTQLQTLMLYGALPAWACFVAQSAFVCRY